MSTISLTTAAKCDQNMGTLTRSYIAAETLVPGQPVYKLAAGTVGKADANASGKQQFRGFVISDGRLTCPAGTPVKVAYFGPIDGFDVSAMDVDVLVYLSDIAGEIQTTAGTMTVPVGRIDMRDDGTKFIFTDVNWLAQWA